MKRNTFLAIGFLFFSYGASSQVITTVAGNGTSGYGGDGGIATAAQLTANGVCADAAGNIYIVDEYRVRKVNAAGIITTYAGNGLSGYGGDGGQATAAQLATDTQCGIAADAAGNVYIADRYNQRIRKVNTAGIITTVAGVGTYYFSGDGGAATAAQLYEPSGVAVDAAGNLYIADTKNDRIRKVNVSGTISTVAGNGTGVFGGDDGPATTAIISRPAAVAVDASGNIYIADANDNRIRKVNTSGIITTIAGNSGSSFSGDGVSATATSLSGAQGVAVDMTGNVYIADTYNGRVRKVNSSGIISTVAGGGAAFSGGDGGPATAGTLQFPNGVTVNTAGDIYISQAYSIRKVNTGTASVHAINVLPGNLSIYPNPSKSVCTVDVPQPAQSPVLTIVNAEGRVIVTQMPDTQTQKTFINTDALSPATYFVILKDGNKTYSSKMIVQK